METEKQNSHFHSPFPLSTDSTVGSAHTKPVHCEYIYHLACGHAMRRVHVASIKDQLGYMTDPVVRSEIVDADRAERSERSKMLPVG